MVNELKPCPFCGGPGKLIHTMGLWAEGKYGPHGSKIVCDYDNTCKAHVASYGDNQTEEAITAWNTRADTARLSELEAALREAELQIEYLHKKFQPTGTGEATLARIRAALEARHG